MIGIMLWWAIILLVGVCVAGGAGLLIAGWRGRRVDDHPVCAGCTFDLVGTWRDGSPPGVCPECGRALGDERAIVRGNRRRSHRVFVAGGALVCAGLLVLSPVVVSALARESAKPTWLLLREIQYRAANRAAPALNELMSRHHAGLLSPGDQLALARRAAQVQGHASEAWGPSWRQVLEDSLIRGTLPANELTRVLGAGATLEVRARRRVMAGRAIPLEVGVCGTDRFILSRSRWVCVRELLVRVSDASGATVHQAVVNPNFDGGVGSGRIATVIEGAPGLPPGSYTIEYSARAWEVEAPSQIGRVATLAEPVLEGHGSQAIEVLPEGVRSVEEIHDADAAGYFQTRLSWTVKTDHSAAYGAWISMTVGTLSLSVGMDDRLRRLFWQGVWIHFSSVLEPVDPSAGPTILFGDQPSAFGQLGADQGRWHVQPPSPLLQVTPKAGRYRLRLRPDLDHAEGTIDIYRMLADELVFDVDVE